MSFGTTLLKVVVKVVLPPVVVLLLVQGPLCLALLHCGVVSFLAMSHHSQPATWSNSLFSSNQLQVRFEWFNSLPCFYLQTLGNKADSQCWCLSISQLKVLLWQRYRDIT